MIKTVYIWKGDFPEQAFETMSIIYSNMEDLLDNFKEQIECGEVGDRIEIEIGEMTQEEIDLLPELS